MSLIDRYDIKVGQVYHRADGTDQTLTVVDTVSFAYCDDVVVKETIGKLTMKATQRIDAFKLVMARYNLCENCTAGDSLAPKPPQHKH